MRLTSIDLSIFILYMVAVLGVGLYASRRGTQTKRDYFLAGDRLRWWMVGGSIVAANISSHHLIGVMGTAYNRGFVAMVIEWGSILIGFNALLWIFLPFYLRNGFYTVPEFLLRRFGASVRTTYAALILLTYVLVEIAAVLCMGALALNVLTGIDTRYSVLMLAAATGIYTITGGLRAVVWTEMLQLGVLLTGGILLSFYTIRAVGGFSAIWAQSSEWHLLLPASDPDFPWTMYLGGTLCISIFYCAANQFIVQRAIAAKDEWHARMGVVFTMYLKFLLPVIIIVPGLVAPRLFPNLAKPDLVFPTLVENLLPTGLVGLVMAGLIAAVMGHTSGAINSCTTIATMDFFVPWQRRRKASGTGLRRPVVAASGEGVGSKPFVAQQQDMDSSDDDRRAVRFGRLFGILVIVVGVMGAELLTSHSKKPIFLYLLSAYGYFTPGIATMFLLGIFWKRTTTAGALAAGLLTIPLSLSLEWIFPKLAFQNRTGIVFWTCMATCAAVSLFSVRKSEDELEGLIWTKESMRMPAAERAKYRGLRRPVIWWALITTVVVLIYIRYA